MANKSTFRPPMIKVSPSMARPEPAYLIRSFASETAKLAEAQASDKIISRRISIAALSQNRYYSPIINCALMLKKFLFAASLVVC